MATTTAFTSLSVPAPDDTMEMSSPANRNLDDDIDIDFDDYPGGVQLTDDERMLEDGDPTRPGTGTDDIMEDDFLPGEHVVIEEETMQDDALQEHVQEDEELIDYGEDDFEDQFLEDTVLPTVAEGGTAITDAAIEEVYDEISREPEAAIPAAPVAELHEPIALVHQPVAESDDFLASEVTAEPDASLAVDEPTAGEPQVFDSAENVDLESIEDLAAPAGGTQPSIQINTEVSNQHDTPGTPTDTGLHPMIVRYSDMEMPLFKSRRQPDGLLKDDNLANVSLAELIRSCRQRLAIKIGENLSEDQELVLGFDHMGLMLVEDSRAAFESSLNDILELYLQLHRNDGTTDVPPLPLSLSLQLKFTSSFAMLKQAASTGQGMSIFSFLAPAGEEEYEHGEYGESHDVQEHREPEYAEEGQEDHIYEGADATEQYDQEYQAPDPAEEDAGEYYEEEHDQEYGEHYEEPEETYHEDKPDPPPGLEQILQGEGPLAGQSADVVYNAPDIPAATGQDTIGDDQVSKDGNSPTSSETVQADAATANAGEYEDLIDWDDDTLMSAFSASTSNEHDDFSTFLTEFDNEEQRNETKDAVQDNANGEFQATDFSANAVDGTFDALQPVSKDDKSHDDWEVPEFNEQFEDDAFAEGDEHDGEGKEYYDHADTYEEQQVEYLSEYQPGDDEEQFHTAQDVFNGEHYEDDQHYEEEDGLDDTLNTVVHHHVEDQEDFEDDLGFDDEAPEQPEDLANLPSTKTGSPRGKRSFDEHVDEDELEFDDRELKKARAV